MKKPSPEATWLRRHGVKLVLSLLIGAGFVWLLHAGALPLVPGPEAFKQLRWWTVPTYLILWTAVHALRAGRWYWLLAPVQRVSLRTILPVAFVGFGAILILPFRTGEVVRPVLMHRQSPVSGWAATGTIAAERIIDGLCLSVVLFVALQLATPLDPLPDKIGALPVPVAVVPGAAYTALLVFAVAFVVMGVFYWRRSWARRATHAVIGLVSPALARWLADRVERVADGLRFLPRVRYSAPFLVATAAYWLLNGAGCWLLAWGCGFDSISFAQGCVNLGVVALGILLPNAPGFFGTYQISSYAGFAMYFPTQDVVTAGAAYVFIIYSAQVAITLLAAVAAMLVTRRGALRALTALDGTVELDH